MRKSIGFLPTLALGLAGAIVSIGPGRAAAVTYTLEAIGSGTLDGVAYTDASLLFTMHNDTTNVVKGPPGGEDFMITGPIAVSVGGGPLATFTDPGTDVFVAQDFGIGFDGTAGFIVLGIISTAFSTYELKTSIGPITSTIASNNGFIHETSSGPFVINSTGDDSTFTAEVAETVPEPSSWILLAMGFAGLGLLYRRDLLRGSAAG
jgi:hypothetical protein